MADFFWDASVNRYRSSKGTFVAASKVNAWRDNAIETSKARVQSIVDRYNAGSLSASAFKREMRGAIKTAFGAEYVFGRGGFKQMTPADWGRLGSEVKRQYQFLDRFVEKLPELSANQISARALMYMDSSVQAHGRGLASAWDVTPPGTPGDGGSACKSNCRCSIRFELEDGGVVMYWDTQADPCPDCASRGLDWHPYKFTP